MLMRRSECDLQFICIYKFSDFMSMYTKASDKKYARKYQLITGIFNDYDIIFLDCWNIPWALFRCTFIFICRFPHTFCVQGFISCQTVCRVSYICWVTFLVNNLQGFLHLPGFIYFEAIYSVSYTLHAGFHLFWSNINRVSYMLCVQGFLNFP